MDNINKEQFMQAFLKADGLTVEYVDVEEIVNNEFVKKLRKRLGMSQSIFATVLGVTKKTIEKWEQGVNPIKGCAARLLHIINNQPTIIDQIYKVKTYNNLNEYNVSISKGNGEKIIKIEDINQYKYDDLKYIVNSTFNIIENDHTEVCC